jgi:CDP-paratose synthetase
MKVLVTGATGFLGGQLVKRLATSGHEVGALARNTSNCAAIGQKVQVLRFGTDAELQAAVASFAPDTVIHAAASYGRAGETDPQILDANFRFGVVLLDACRRLARPVHVINTGTVLHESVSTYAWSKNAFSAWGLRCAGTEGTLRFTDVKLQHMYGPGDDISKFTGHVVASCADDRPELTLTAGDQLRDFIYIDDVVSAYEVLVASAAKLETAEAVEVGSGVALPLRTFVETVHQLAGSRTALRFGALPKRANEAPSYVANIERMRSLGWTCATSLAEGLSRTIAWHRSAKDRQ